MLGCKGFSMADSCKPILLTYYKQIRLLPLLFSPKIKKTIIEFWTSQQDKKIACQIPCWNSMSYRQKWLHLITKVWENNMTDTKSILQDGFEFLERFREIFFHHFKKSSEIEKYRFGQWCKLNSKIKAIRILRDIFSTTAILLNCNLPYLGNLKFKH